RSIRHFDFSLPSPHPTHSLSLHDALPIFSPSLRYVSRPSPSVRRIYCHWLTSFVSNIQKKCVWKLPVLPNKPRYPCSPTHGRAIDRKSTRLNSSHVSISYAVFCLTKKTYA